MVIEGFVPISDAWADARVDRAGARRILRCEEAQLDRLCELGLPSRGEGEEQSFGECDVMNAGLAAGGGRSVPELARRRTLGFAAGEPGEWTAGRAWTVIATASCGCGETRPQAWSVPEACPELHGGGVDFVSVAEQGAGVELRMELRTRGRQDRSREPAIEEEMEALFAEFDEGSLRFHYLPPALRRDPASAVAAGVVDCVALTVHLAHRLRGHGLPVRTHRGHLLSTIGVEHAWLAVGEPPDAVPVDPMLAVLTRGTAAANPLFPRFCVGSVSNRILPWDRSAEEQVFSHACERAEGPPRVTVSARAA